VLITAVLFQTGVSFGKTPTRDRGGSPEERNRGGRPTLRSRAWIELRSRRAPKRLRIELHPVRMYGVYTCVRVRACVCVCVCVGECVHVRIRAHVSPSGDMTGTANETRDCCRFPTR